MKEYLIELKIGDVDEEFTFYTEQDLTRKQVIDSIRVLKRAKPPKHQDKDVDFLKNLFGMK